MEAENNLGSGDHRLFLLKLNGKMMIKNGSSVKASGCKEGSGEANWPEELCALSGESGCFLPSKVRERSGVCIPSKGRGPDQLDE